MNIDKTIKLANMFSWLTQKIPDADKPLFLTRQKEFSEGEELLQDLINNLEQFKISLPSNKENLEKLKQSLETQLAEKDFHFKVMKDGGFPTYTIDHIEHMINRYKLKIVKEKLESI